MKFYYNPSYKYTNRHIIDLTDDTDYAAINYVNIDSPDTINGHIIYVLNKTERLPTYVVDDERGRRWFVSGITQLNSSKYQISLLRDIISENPEQWAFERAYIAAGTATNYNRYKRWDLPFTNTKVKQERLNVNGKSSFFVYYVNEQTLSGGVMSEQDLHIESSGLPGYSAPDVTVSSLSELDIDTTYLNAGDLSSWNNDRGIVRAFMPRGVNYQGDLIEWGSIDFDVSSPPNPQLYGTISQAPGTGVWPGKPNPLFPAVSFDNILTINFPSEQIIQNVNDIGTNFKAAVKQYLLNYRTDTLAYTTISDVEINRYNYYGGKLILNTGDNTLYRIHIEKRVVNENIPLAPGTLLSALRNLFPQQVTVSEYGNWFIFNSQRTVYNYTLEEIGSANTFDFTFKKDVKKLPRSAVRCVNIVSDNTISDIEIMQALMVAQTNGINPDNTVGRILDIQYLPFQVAALDTGGGALSINSHNLICRFLETDEYQYTTSMSSLDNINKETDSIKIVSPSRASQFLFRPYNNDGRMVFDTKVMLKPYLSTIYVRPSTQGLLMYDWDDKDCLIIQEDFSLTNVTSEWTQYIYNNKTYLNVFERQIQGREFERGWERRVEQAQKKADEWSARNLSAEKARTYTGNLPIVSSIAGAIGTAWADANYMQAAALDREYNEALYQQSISLSRDLFDYQLENLQSQPWIPGRITTIDNKFLDGIYLEYYSTNDTELAAISNYYTYNGNRIDDYGNFYTYWGSFIRGKILIAYNYTQPEIEELNRRLSTGIFTGGYNFQ